MFNYEEIKLIAKEQKCSVQDYLALSSTNDPFYVGSPGQMQKAKWFADVYRKMGQPDNVHVRRVHYWLVSQPDYRKPDGTRYMNTELDWGFLTLASKYARYAGLVPIENVVDRRNPDPKVNAVYWEDEKPSEEKESIDAEEIISTIAKKFYCFNPHNTQAYMLELWCEKSTMNDVLEPIAKSFGANLVTGLGELSITAVHLLVERIKRSDKPVRIFYISDFDPAGECMPVSVARKIEYFMRQEGVERDVRLVPVMLTAEQCTKFKLPRTPIKVTERRKEGFENRHGLGATELDALEALYPGQMRKLIERTLSEYFDVDAWNDVVEKNKELRSKVEDFLQEKIGDVLEELDVEEFDEYAPPRAELREYDEEFNWLYNSSWTYSEQLERYKEHKRQGGDE